MSCGKSGCRGGEFALHPRHQPLRKPIQQNQFPANQHNGGAVHAESFDRGASVWRPSANSPGGRECEMIRPDFRARVEQRRNAAGSWIKGRSSSRLAKRTRYARQSKVFQFRWSVLRTRQHMVNVKRGSLRRLRQAAVLADIVRPVSNLSNEPNGNLRTHRFLWPARSARSFIRESKSTNSVSA